MGSFKPDRVERDVSSSHTLEALATETHTNPDGCCAALHKDK